MTSPFYEIQKGHFETELLNLRLSSEQHGAFSGQGFLRWGRATGFEIRLLTDGGRALSPDILSGTGLSVGSLAPPKSYLRLDATSRSGHAIVVERVVLNPDLHYGNETVVWPIDSSHVKSVVNFTRGPESENADFIEILLSGGHRLDWPAQSVSDDGLVQGCLQVETTLGNVFACGLPNGDVRVMVEPPTPCAVNQLVDAVSSAFCFWAGKILRVIGYEARNGDASQCRLLPSHRASAGFGRARPLGHARYSLLSQHCPLVAKALDYFSREESKIIGSLLQSKLGSDDLPFSLGILAACSAPVFIC